MKKLGALLGFYPLVFVRSPGCTWLFLVPAFCDPWGDWHAHTSYGMFTLLRDGTARYSENILWEWKEFPLNRRHVWERDEAA